MYICVSISLERGEYAFISGMLIFLFHFPIVGIASKWPD